MENSNIFKEFSIKCDGEGAIAIWAVFASPLALISVKFQLLSQEGLKVIKDIVKRETVDAPASRGSRIGKFL